MRKARLVVFAPAAAVLGMLLAQGCQDATQVTLEVSLAKRASCTETNGTAITVGSDPSVTESRVRDEYVTAATASCTDATRQIGTLVLTPGENGRTSVIVVVSYDKNVAPSACKPPAFQGCIVARRQIAFAEHRNLTLPITIDPDCKNVPCDAFSTCRNGKCFPSETQCSGALCAEPGDPGDGGTSVDGQVVPNPDGEGGMSEAGSDAADASDGATSVEAGADASEAGNDGSTGTTTGVYCTMSNELRCPDTTCGVGSSCCKPQGASAAACMPNASGMAGCEPTAVQYCCQQGVPCPTAKTCVGGGVPVNLQSGPPSAPSAWPIPKWAPLPVGSESPGTCQQ